MTRIQKGKQLGERWDRVKLENGIVGYIYQTYVSEAQSVEIEKIEIDIENKTLQKGESKKLNVTIYPEEAKENEIIYISSKPEVATIDDLGNIKAISSGKTTITVKSKDNSVKADIDIEVYSKVTGINIDQDEIFMQEGDMFKINSYVEPNDANNQNILYDVENLEVATIDENGIIEAKKVGETNIIVKAEENQEIKEIVKVIVVRKMEDSEIHFDSSLNVNSLEISGLDYTKNTADEIKKLITTDLEIEIVNNKDVVLKDNQYVGTGSKIIVKEDGKILREYKIILYGDVNGDGKINSVDLLVLQRHILEIEELGEIYRKAANINKNGKKPTSVDLLLIQRHILKLQIINQ